MTSCFLSPASHNSDSTPHAVYARINPHTFLVVILFLQNNTSVILDILTKILLNGTQRPEHKNNGKKGVWVNDSKAPYIVRFFKAFSV